MILGLLLNLPLVSRTNTFTHNLKGLIKRPFFLQKKEPIYGSLIILKVLLFYQQFSPSPIGIQVDDALASSASF